MGWFQRSEIQQFSDREKADEELLRKAERGVADDPERDRQAPAWLVSRLNRMLDAYLAALATGAAPPSAIPVVLLGVLTGARAIMSVTGSIPRRQTPEVSMEGFLSSGVPQIRFAPTAA